MTNLAAGASGARRPGPLPSDRAIPPPCLRAKNAQVPTAAMIVKGEPPAHPPGADGPAPATAQRIPPARRDDALALYKSRLDAHYQRRLATPQGVMRYAHRGALTCAMHPTRRYEIRDALNEVLYDTHIRKACTAQRCAAQRFSSTTKVTRRRPKTLTSVSARSAARVDRFAICSFHARVRMQRPAQAFAFHKRPCTACRRIDQNSRTGSRHHSCRAAHDNCPAKILH